MIKGWRTNFQTLDLPFFYVELCVEYGAQEPKEADFWMAQRSALELPNTGFATTTDIERALHPPDKQDVARRLLLEIRRVAYGDSVVSRGPELVSVSRRRVSPVESSGGSSTIEVTLTFSNSSLVTHEGIYVGKPGVCTTPFVQRASNGTRSPAEHKIDGNKVVVTCTPPAPVPGSAAPSPFNHTIMVNSDTADCFLYGPTGLPAPPIEVTCANPPTEEEA